MIEIIEDMSEGWKIQKSRSEAGKQVMQMFSVVIPAYNCEDTICRVLDSVKNQTKYNKFRMNLIIQIAPE